MSRLLTQRQLLHPQNRGFLALFISILIAVVGSVGVAWIVSIQSKSDQSTENKEIHAITKEVIEQSKMDGPVFAVVSRGSASFSFATILSGQINNGSYSVDTLVHLVSG